MHRPSVNLWLSRHRVSWLLWFAVAAIAGCHNGEECKSCHDIVPGAIPQPSGTYDCQWIHAEKARAEQDKFVIYNYEWSANASQLTSSGHEHIGEIARALCQVPFPVVIEPSCDRHVDDLRRAAVLEALANSGNPVSPDRVIFGRGEAEGLYGLEAPGVARRMLATQGGGQGGGGSALGVGSTLGGTQGNVGSSSGVGVGVGVGMGSY